ncbi:MAG: adenylyltransferase/cytidyltransferase family protein [Candidatus Latescibacteria bacterium]|nr:adenylyltransferase/cytidyltransferase family protein [bacterium]MBD3423343.1 adenylyltransferase/cytidyltransferase family protein [Candidatus Latescibacterota bacterium]
MVLTEIYTSIEKLADELARARKKSGPVVLANGCFDIIHAGHIRYLRDASTLGGIMVVAVNDDRSARELKGDGRPVFPQDERAEIIAALEGVDYVLIFGELSVDGILRKLRPEIHAKGTDYTPETVPERETAESIGCRTVITGDPKDHSSRDIIKEIAGRDRFGSQ